MFLQRLALKFNIKFNMQKFFYILICHIIENQFIKLKSYYGQVFRMHVLIHEIMRLIPRWLTRPFLEGSFLKVQSLTPEIREKPSPCHMLSYNF